MVAALACARPARAEEPTDDADVPAPAATDLGEPAPTERPPDRPVPDYDGLPEPGDDAGDVALWTARILTSPLYLVTEFVLRRPIGWAMTEIERHHLIQYLIKFLRFGPDETIMVVPTVFYELGFRPSIGLYASWDRFLFAENRISAHAAWGGSDWLSGSITDRIEIDDHWQVGATFLARQRPDYVFGGIGYDATALPRARFGAERVEPVLWSAIRYWRSSDVEAEVRYRGIGFFDRTWDDEPSVTQRAEETGQALPYGYATGYEAVSTELRVDLDTRTPGAPPETHARLAAHVGMHGAFGGLPRLEQWVSWGASATLAADVLGGHRVLGVTADAHFVSPLDDSDVPFTELVDLGGARGLLPGYRPGHVQGYSAVGLTAQYTWALWAFLDARAYLGTANAFGVHLEDFDVERLRLTFGLELMPRLPSGPVSFTFNFGFATETFENGAGVNSFRLAIGSVDLL